MARNFLTGLRLVNLDSDPASGNEGELYFNTSASVTRIYRSGAWNDLDTKLSQEEVQDYIAPLFTNAVNTNVVATYDDANNVINLNTSGSLISIDSIKYPDYIVFDTTPETTSASAGTVFWDSGDGLLKLQLNANVQLGIGQESVALVKNSTGSSIAKGKIVYISGAQGQRPTITLADADTEPTSSKTFGFTAETIADGAEGYVVTEGVLRGIDTGGLTEGGAIWLSQTAGEFTQTIPTQPANSVFVGYVVKANGSSGEVFVKIQNGYELGELHNVKLESNGNIGNNELLVYNSASGLWINQTPLEAGFGTAALTASTTYAQNSFTTISTPSGTSPVADSTSDTLTLSAGTGITITGDSSTDTITIASTIVDTNTTYTFDTGTTNGAFSVTPSGGSAQVVPIYGLGTAAYSASTSFIDTSSTSQTKTGNFTSSGDVTGSILKSSQSSGDEGGQVDLALAQTNTTLTGNVSIDVYQNRLRFFETGGTARGYYIDLTGGGAGAGTNLVGGGSASDSFKTISVAGQSDVVADSSTDTLTLVAGSNITITTNASTDTITIASTASGGGDASFSDFLLMGG